MSHRRVSGQGPRGGAKTWSHLLGVASRSSPRIAIDGVEISHPDRVLYPDRGITKGEVALYYHQMSSHILAHIAGRPLSVVRCPSGVDPGAAAGIHQTYRGPKLTKCFFQKHTSDRTSRYLRSVRAPEQTKWADYLAVEDARDLLTLVQFGTLEFHPWGSRSATPDAPDRMFFDLDPGPDVSWEALANAARSIRDILEPHRLTAFVKTTGGKGLHVVVPLAGRNSWDEVKAFSQGVAEAMASEHPDRYVAQMSKKLRSGKIFIDYLRNSRGATAVAAYSTRALPGATVSLPVGWSDLGSDLRRELDLCNVPKKLARRRADPWADFFEAAGVLPMR